jgi:1-deoxy-D-xylulose-5-phosphate reductoisomerase
VLGSTGTIGRQALDVVSRLNESLEIVALAAGRNLSLLAEQTALCRPRSIVVADPAARTEIRSRLAPGWTGEILAGPEGVAELAGNGEADVVLNAIVGLAGLGPTLAALRSGVTLALANKESLVIAGDMVRAAAAANNARIIPVDSEHSGLMQCLEGRAPEVIERVILTASGGPFRNRPLDTFAAIRPEEALRHPTWRMGSRITVDSATLLNKGFEVHEARWLFDIPPDRIEVWIHPQSIVHALVELTDGGMIAQLSVPDMRLAIQLALTHPARPATGLPRCDLTTASPLEFENVDRARYPCLGVALDALAIGGIAPAAMNAADEILVGAFLEGRIPFTGIAEGLNRIVGVGPPEDADSIETIMRADANARLRARLYCGGE